MKKKVLIITINTIILLFILNCIIILGSKYIFHQKNFPRNVINLFPAYYSIFYSDINDRKLNNYIAILGDSHAYGSGDEYLKNSFNFSIAHYLRIKNKNINYLNFGIPGGGSITILDFFINSVNKSFLFPKIEKPKKIIYLFYEGNDLENNILHINESNFSKKMLKIKNILYDYFPIFRFIHLSGKRIYLKIKKGIKTKKSKEKPNKILMNNRSVFAENLQGSPLELNKEQLKNSLDILELSIISLKKYSNNVPIYIIYIPSPITIYNFQGKIYFQTYFNKISNTITKSENDLLSETIKFEVKKISKKLNLNFVDTTIELKEIGKNELVHGPLDYKHPNKIGYTQISDIICKKINCVNY